MLKLIRVFGENTFDWTEVSFFLIRSMISWFPFRNRTLCNPPGPQLSWKILSDLEEKYPGMDMDDLRDVFGKYRSRSSKLIGYKWEFLRLPGNLSSKNHFEKCQIHIPICQNFSSDCFDSEEDYIIEPSNNSGDLGAEKESFLLPPNVGSFLKAGFPDPPKMEFESIKDPRRRTFTDRSSNYYHKSRSVVMKTTSVKISSPKKNKFTTVYRDTDSHFIKDDYLSKRLIFKDTKITYTEADRNLGKNMFNSALETVINKIRPHEEEIIC